MENESFRFKFLGCCLLYSLILSLNVQAVESEKSPIEPNESSTTVMEISFEIEGSPVYFTASLDNAPWGNLAIFYEDSEVGSANGLIHLGKFNAPPDFLGEA